MYQTSCVCVVECTRTSLWSRTTLTMSVGTRLYTGKVVDVVYYSDIIQCKPVILKSMIHSPKKKPSLCDITAVYSGWPYPIAGTIKFIGRHNMYMLLELQKQGLIV